MWTGEKQNNLKNQGTGFITFFFPNTRCLTDM